MEKLEWLPLYIDKLLSSPAWLHMRDYQRGWYIQLLLLCTRSERLGYLRLDGRIWMLAGAHSKAMWEQHKAAVMACFKVRDFDGQSWLYNNRLLSVMENQSEKYLRKNNGASSHSYSPSQNLKSKTKPREEVCSPNPELKCINCGKTGAFMFGKQALCPHCVGRVPKANQ